VASRKRLPTARATSQMPLSCPVAPPSQRELRKDGGGDGAGVVRRARAARAPKAKSSATPMAMTKDPTDGPFISRAGLGSCALVTPAGGPQRLPPGAALEAALEACGDGGVTQQRQGAPHGSHQLPHRHRHRGEGRKHCGRTAVGVIGVVVVVGAAGPAAGLNLAPVKRAVASASAALSTSSARGRRPRCTCSTASRPVRSGAGTCGNGGEATARKSEASEIRSSNGSS